MKGLKRFILKCSSIFSAVAFAVCLCFVVLMYAVLLRLFHFLPRQITPFRINNGKIHSASETMSKCLLAGSTQFHKVPANSVFPDRKYAPPRHTTYQILIDFQLVQLNFDFIMFFLLLEPFINRVVFLRIAMTFRITGTFTHLLSITKFKYCNLQCTKYFVSDNSSVIRVFTPAHNNHSTNHWSEKIV